MTEKILRLLYAAAIDPQTLEPRRFFFFLVYYVMAFFVAFIVLTMILLCFEVFHIHFLRDLLYSWMGESLLVAVEKILFR